MPRTLTTGKVLDDTDRDAFVATCLNQWNKVDLPTAANNLIALYGPDLCFQAVDHCKGYWRYWTDTHWALIHNALFGQDIHWLLAGLGLPKHINELIDSMKISLTVAHDRFDKKPIVAFDNCVLQIKDNRICGYSQGFQRDDYLTHTVPIPIALPPPPTPKWNAMLDLILPDHDDRKTLQEMMGCCFFPAVHLQTFFALVGDAGTGKTTITRLLIDMLGQDRVTTKGLDRLGGQHDTSGLIGSLVNIADEQEFLDSKSEAILKTLTGDGSIDIEPKYKTSYSAVLPVKIIMMCNSMPRFSDKTEGVWSRLVTIPFNAPIPAEKRKPMDQVLADLRPEHSGILAWALIGLRRVLPCGTRATAFTQSTTAKDQNLAHRHYSNPFLDWFETYTVTDPEVLKSMDIDPTELARPTKKEDYYSSYKLWYMRNMGNSSHCLGSSSFYKEMNRVPLQKGLNPAYRTRLVSGANPVKRYTGIYLKTPQEAADAG